ncbi:MAG: hypothetical protein HUK06_02620 [Bacteroidaceae bacterium]|nr:hypothetical protein [Bacteroidaceae bacterium]
MKKTVINAISSKSLLLAFAMIISVCAVAQNKQERPSKEEMQQKKWQQISEKLMLTDKQSQKVAPLFADYQKEMKALKPERKDKEKKSLIDAEVKEQMKNKFATMRKKADIQEKYFNKFLNELSPRQAKYLINHAGFKKAKKGNNRMMPQWREQRKNFNGNPMGMGQFDKRPMGRFNHKGDSIKPFERNKF